MPLAKSLALYRPQSNIQVLKHNNEFQLESGRTLPELDIAYCTHGTLNDARDNVIWIFHALTANADATEWWPGLVGDGHLIDPTKYFIVCANILGSCYGTTGPDHINPETNEKYGLDFPIVTIKDMVKVHQILKAHLQIEKVYLGLGGSMGGQQLLEWAISEPELFENICAIATNARHSAWGIAFNTSQRMALEADQTFEEKAEGSGMKGLQAARAIAMLSYRNQNAYRKTQTDFDDRIDDFKASSYQRYQGKKLSDRFTPHSYWYLSRAMDSHNVGRGYKTVRHALKLITARALVLGIQGDLLFPYGEQKFIAKNINDAEFGLIDSFYGHDGFLIETNSIADQIIQFLD